MRRQPRRFARNRRNKERVSRVSEYKLYGGYVRGMQDAGATTPNRDPLETATSWWGFAFRSSHARPPIGAGMKGVQCLGKVGPGFPFPDFLIVFRLTFRSRKIQNEHQPQKKSFSRQSHNPV